MTIKIFVLITFTHVTIFIIWYFRGDSKHVWFKNIKFLNKMGGDIILTDHASIQ